MILTDWTQRNLLPVISSTQGLMHVFIVILFFENYFILVESKSMLDIRICFDKLKIAPFVYFFFFIAVSKSIWFIICFLRIQFFYRYTDTENTITAQTSFIVFTLGIVLFFYLGNISSNPSLIPIDEVKHYFLSKLYQFFFVINGAVCFFIFLIQSPDKII